VVHVCSVRIWASPRFTALQWGHAANVCHRSQNGTPRPPRSVIAGRFPRHTANTLLQRDTASEEATPGSVTGQQPHVIRGTPTPRRHGPSVPNRLGRQGRGSARLRFRHHASQLVLALSRLLVTVFITFAQAYAAISASCFTDARCFGRNSKMPAGEGMRHRLSPLPPRTVSRQASKCFSVRHQPFRIPLPP